MHGVRALLFAHIICRTFSMPSRWQCRSFTLKYYKLKPRCCRLCSHNFNARTYTGNNHFTEQQNKSMQIPSFSCFLFFCFFFDLPFPRFVEANWVFFISFFYRLFLVSLLHWSFSAFLPLLFLSTLLLFARSSAPLLSPCDCTCLYTNLLDQLFMFQPNLLCYLHTKSIISNLNELNLSGWIKSLFFT